MNEIDSISTPTTLAFGFASPFLLVGLALAGIPILIHLLHKRQFKETYWAAMRFLLEAARKNSRRLRLEQLILLIVRVLVVILLVLALARPYVETFGTYFQAEVPTHRIIVIDASFSMGYQTGGSRRFDRAKEVARQIVASASRGDALNLVRICGSEPRAIVRQPAFQQTPVTEEIDQLKLTDERGDLLATLLQIQQLLKEAPEILQKEITLISDFQRDTWSNPASGQATQIRHKLKEIAEKANLVFIDLGQAKTQNAAVVGLDVDQPFITVNREISINVAARNFGSDPLPGQLIELYADGRRVQTKRIDLDPGTETPTNLTHTFRISGQHQLEVRLEDDALPIDNRRYLALTVKEELNVLLINGKQAGRNVDTATYYLLRALQPSTAKNPWRGFIRPTVKNEGDLPGLDLTRFDCVFLCDVALFTEREAGLLHAFVESGGGLVISLGERIKPDNYNQQLYRDGKGVLPAALGNRTNWDGRMPFFFDPGDFEHPIVREFQGSVRTGLQSTLTFSYVKTQLPADGSTQVALKFNTGDAAILSSTFGQGRTVLVTTTVDQSWSAWPISANNYIPIMHEIVLHAVAGPSGERQLEVGNAISRMYSSRVFDMPITVTLPNEKEESIRLIEGDLISSVAFEGTRQAGIYKLNLGAPLNRTELFAVNVDARECDLSKLDGQTLSSEFLPGIDFVYRTDWQNIERHAEVTVVERGGLTRWLLYAALCLFLIELTMAWKFQYGFMLLYSAVVAEFIRAAVIWNVIAGFAILVVAIAGFVLLVRGHVVKLSH